MDYTIQVGLYIEANVISLLVLCVIALRVALGDSMDQALRMYYRSTFCMGITIITDVVNCICQYKGIFPWLILTCEMISGASILLVCLFWLAFIERYNDVHPPRWMWWVLRIPAFIIFFLIALSPFGYGVYWVTEPGVYVRGPMYQLKPLTYTFYMVVQFIAVVYSVHRTQNPQIRKDLRYFEVFSVFPIAGALLQQAIGAAYPITNPSFTIALLWAYTGIAYRESNLDTLTGLNKRQVLIRYLNNLVASNVLPVLPPSEQEDYYLYMMDLNHFKNINDRFGHQEGDRALAICAEAFRKVFDGHRGCLCRYGGDEFAAVLYGTKETADFIRSRVNDELKSLQKEHGLKYDLAVSVGCVKVTAHSYEELKADFHQADREMYKEKERMEAGSRKRPAV
ncbi:MAG: GGDEF domain-containing protein [Eubacterium sp.]|nr:GGDEF domain-containing protein [Eubacterium sp.]